MWAPQLGKHFPGDDDDISNTGNSHEEMESFLDCTILSLITAHLQQRKRVGGQLWARVDWGQDSGLGDWEQQVGSRCVVD